MSDSLDIQNLLQTGYFTSSRAKNTAPSSPRPEAVRFPSPGPAREDRIPRSISSAPRSRHSYPPAPSVEDEADSLAREYGVSGARESSDEEPQSRGDIDQNPIIMEVHEYNPERRFVILNDPPKASEASPEAKTPQGRAPKSPSPEVNGSTKPQPDRQHGSGAPKEHLRTNSERPGFERRRSRQDLPPIETELRADRAPEHHRSKSSASASRPDYFFPRQTRPYGDQLLSPDIISSGAGGREKTYRGLGQSSNSGGRSTSRQSYHEGSARRRDDKYYYYNGRDAPSARRSETSFENRKPSRRQSNDWVSDSRYRKETSSSRGDRRETSQSYSRGDIDRPPKSPILSREQSRSSDVNGKDAQAPYTPKKPVIVQQDRPPVGTRPERNGDEGDRARPPSRTGTFPLPSPSQAAIATAAAGATAAAMTPRGSATFPLPGAERSRPSEAKMPLPYPDDDIAYHGLGIDDGEIAPDHMAAPVSIPVVSMPEPSSVISDRPMDPSKTVGPAATPKEPTWQPPAFDPAKDGLRVDNGRRMGSYRRFSESKEHAESGGLPECPRTKPIAGLVDWLTLPRTNFNICPTCYETVFARSEFRTQFQPMLRPTSEAIACDFGSSAWYRIAWLLTLKHKTADLRLLHQVANVATSIRNETCPGNRKATRTWLTVIDPSTKHPVPEFAVCYECARTVEVLLPNLTGLFVPLEPRSEPSRDLCALHFMPKREQFVLYFDALETTSDKAFVDDKAPDVARLAKELQQLSIGGDCREDSPVVDGYWHIMQFLPQFTVCTACFNDTVQPKIEEGSSLAQNFYMKPQKLPSATCQLYSTRMREVFFKACRRKDPAYLKDRVLERRDIETEIYEKLLKLDRSRRNDAWTEEQVEKLVKEWRRWE
ncbi:proteinrelated to ser/arg-related nuclear matrix protein [Purpureocillium lilacinum]|uniref:Proteinrelated to ser/arg-related nuclear matrix protein n=1 Tax=Purpureocillium lilacinum TaxID=33203 RepID=A0A179H7G1_PURLI|nr:proteinrelated to ser/arg-related nuclear matrix protein [Purpureocillium lilacinum]OAQ85501.1 proteinrelated to ser/arg-related nuclear matrix protein [Purpureocillium lilacinum]